MKKYLILALLLITIFHSRSLAQSSTSSTAVYSLPRTVLKVEIKSIKTEIKPGPYARYAQKYLGMVVPLSNKTIYTIESARITPFEENDPDHVYILENVNENDRKALLRKTHEGFVSNGINKLEDRFASKVSQEIDMSAEVENDYQLQIDKSGIIGLNQDQMAQNAAQTIFMLRKKRLDLLTGEVGENVFGEGLKVAVDELKRMEQEYIELFTGKQNTKVEVHTFELIPQDESSVIVCRFSVSHGFMEETDLRGAPIVLEFKPEQKVQESSVKSEQKGAKIFVRVADIVNVNVIENGSSMRVIGSDRVPIYQFGKIMTVPVSLSK